MVRDMGFAMEEAFDRQFNGIRQNIKASWERCMVRGLVPSDPINVEKISPCELRDILDEYREIIEITQPYINRIRLVIPSEYSFVGLCDSKSTVLYRVGDLLGLEELGFHEGCIASEESLGNNCFGTCIVTNGEPTIIFGEEHYLDVFKEWASYAAAIHNSEGAIVAVLGVVMPIQYANKNILGMIVVAARGIEKELKLLDENTHLHTINEGLTELNQDVAKTASMLSHEIKNSLSTVSAYVQLLQLEGTLNHNKGDRILLEILRINKLLEDFKRLSMPAKLKFARHSLNEILEFTVDIMRSNANIKGIDIKLIMGLRPVYARVDRDSIQQVFVNLILNAIQAMENGKTLTIRLIAKRESSFAVIEFEDMGVGIPENELGGIFKLFYTTKNTGSGLGLPFCVNIVKNHGGEIEVESKVGVGSTFRIQLPSIL